MKRLGRWLLGWGIIMMVVGYGWWWVSDEPLWQEKVSGMVVAAARQGEVEMLVILEEQADLEGAERVLGKEAKGRYVYERLRDVAGRSQAPLLAHLEVVGVPYRAYWIQNMIWVRGDERLVRWLAARPEVAWIGPNPVVGFDEPMWVEGETLGGGVPWGVAEVDAPSWWSGGITGEGIVIGGQDTGYEWTHEALRGSYRGWDGETAVHDYHWHDAIHVDNGDCMGDSVAPCDDYGHGTHTMGTAVGNNLDRGEGGWPGAASEAIGVAPGAQWIGCRNMNNGNGTPASYAECYEWFIAPYPRGGDPLTDGRPEMAPHVISNSWSCPPSEGCTEVGVLAEVVAAVRAAGIVTVHSAGNSGAGGCGTVNTPAAIYADSLTVGAVGPNGGVTSFSSRGPVTVDGSNRLKPDVMAPGLGVRSAALNNRYNSGSGTSMAAPHVAGMVALLLAAEPALIGDVAGVEAWLKGTAAAVVTLEGCGGDEADSVPNHTYGWGTIDGNILLREGILDEDMYLPAVVGE
ncbi:MAG TPA: S8 family serine peptidase [Anaerolineae bacterium]|nr:S8 family serine peptidase [Anaerolineae bacterium]